MTSLNHYYRKLAMAQGPLQPALWVLPAFSGQTGYSHSYGWRSDHLVTAEWARLVIQCYAARPAYYDNEPVRESGYFLGCRPLGWLTSAKTIGDYMGNPDGSQDVEGVTASGPDAEHFPLSPLTAIADSKGIALKLPNGQAVFAQEIAADLLRRLSAAHAGMFRKLDGSVTGEVLSARVATYVLRTLVDCGKRGLLAPADAATLRDYIHGTMLPAWEDGISTGKGGINVVYNGELGWTTPALYDYIRALPAQERIKPVPVRLWHVLEGWCKRLALLEYLKPGLGCQTEKVDSWSGLTEKGVTTTWYYGATLVRSMDVAGVVLGRKELRAAALAEALLWKDRKSDTYDIKSFLVGADKAFLI